MKRIDQIWTELEGDLSGTSGLLFRRYSAVIQPDLFVALKVPEKVRCIATSVSNSVNIDLSGFTNLKDIQAEVIADPERPNRHILLFKLINAVHSDVFSALCEDLMLSIGNPYNQEDLIKSLLTRFFKWKSLFDKIHEPGLTQVEQHGLFAELFFLRKMLSSKDLTASEIVRFWVGPEKQIKDFQKGNIAIEVKCTTGSNHQRIHINGERQLDSSQLARLFLYHLSAEVRLNGGETLVTLICEIRSFLSEDVIALAQFNSKLMEAGYFEHHAHQYEATGYTIRNESYYNVSGNFPRLEEKDLRPGVGDVKYSIITSLCSEYMLTEEDVFNELTL